MQTTSNRRARILKLASCMVVGAALVVTSGQAAAKAEGDCAKERGSVESRYLSCDARCELRAATASIRGRSYDATACTDLCRGAYEKTIARMERGRACDHAKVAVTDFGELDQTPMIRGIVDTPSGPIETVLAIAGDVAVFEGDIVVGTVEEVRSRMAAELSRRSGDGTGGLASPQAAVRRDQSARWPRGLIPVRVDPSLINPTTGVYDARVVAALRHWEANTPVRFVGRTSEADFVTFRMVADPNKCSSSVGRVGGQQFINLGNNCGQGAVIHEIGHAVGLWHEQSRSDRDRYVTVNWDNIVDDDWKRQFRTYIERGEDGMDLEVFDFNSIMLYGSMYTSWVAKDPTKPIMTKKDGSLFSGGGSVLSMIDRASVRRMYRAPAGSIVGLGGRCIDVRGNVSFDGTPLMIHDCHGQPNQQWMASGGALRGLANKCLNMPAAANGVTTTLSTCFGSTNQRFDVANAQIRSPGDLCLTKPSADWPVSLGTCGGGGRQAWTYTPSGELRTPDGLCLDVYASQTGNGAMVGAWPCHGGANQRWGLGADGVVRGLGGKCLDIPAYQDRIGRRLQMHDCNGGTNQKWALRGQIRNPLGKCLDLPFSSTAGGTPVHVHDCHTEANQKWTFYP